MGLGKGSPVRIYARDGSTLCIEPEVEAEERRVRRAVIDVSDETKPESLVRKVVSAYLVGYNIIQLRNVEKRIAMPQRYAIKDLIRKKLLGIEILADLPQELTLQVLVGHGELSVKDALRRMSTIAASMHRDAIMALMTDDPELGREVIATDDEVDRFGLYIIRLLKMAVSDSRVLKEIGLSSPRECLGYRLITKSVERMADHAANIAQNSLTLTPMGLSQELLKEIKTMSDSALRVFEDAIEALFEWDYTIADGVFDEAEETRRMEVRVVQKAIKHAPTEGVPALRLIIESIRRTAEYGSDIAEIVLNLTIKEEIED
jgi:phosphate uptake regulator